MKKMPEATDYRWRRPNGNKGMREIKRDKLRNIKKAFLPSRGNENEKERRLVRAKGSHELHELLYLFFYGKNSVKKNLLQLSSSYGEISDHLLPVAMEIQQWTS